VLDHDDGVATLRLLTMGMSVGLRCVIRRSGSSTASTTAATILHDVCLDIPDGKVTAILGRNGTGKTTC